MKLFLVIIFSIILPLLYSFLAVIINLGKKASKYEQKFTSKIFFTVQAVNLILLVITFTLLQINKLNWELLIGQPFVREEICPIRASVLQAHRFYYRNAQNLVKSICPIRNFIL